LVVEAETLDEGEVALRGEPIAVMSSRAARHEASEIEVFDEALVTIVALAPSNSRSPSWSSTRNDVMNIP